MFLLFHVFDYFSYFSDVNILQGSVAVLLIYGGIFITNVQQSVAAEEF